jgi:hypothetical protein
MSKLKTKQILPMNPRAHCFCCISVGHPVGELQDVHNREPPGRGGELSYG